MVSDLDVITKFFGEKNYLRAHRRQTHQIHVAFILALIAPLIFFHQTSHDFSFFYILSLLCIMLHLLLDSLNPYGTKILPFYKRVKFNVVATVDIFILILLALNILAVRNGHLRFLISLPIYLIIRLFAFNVIKIKIKKHYNVKQVYLLSTYHPFKWHIMIDSPNNFLVATFYFKITNEKIISKEYIDFKYLMKIYQTKEYIAFSQLAYLYASNMTKDNNLVTITLYDLKYYKNEKFYFKLIYKFKDDEINSTYLGFTFKKDIN